MNLRDYIGAARAAAQPDPAEPLHMKPCPACARELSSEARACPHCGHRMPRRPLSRRVKMIVGAVAACVLLVLYSYARHTAAEELRKQRRDAQDRIDDLRAMIGR